MGWRYIFNEAWAALRFHRQRTIFTTMSLGWGVACFVILMSYGDGFERALVKAFSAVGQDLVLTFGGQTSEQAGGQRAGRKVRLELDDLQALRDTVPLIDHISPEIMRYGLKANVRGKEKEVTLRAVRTEYNVIRNIHLTSGRWINVEDEQKQHRVAVLGSKVAKELYAGAPPVGEELILNGIRFTVIGVMETKLQIANYNRPDNECIFLPYDTYAVFGDVRYPWFLVWKPISPEARDRAIAMVRARLAEIHRFNPKDEKAVEIMPFSKFMSIITGMSLAVKLLLGFVGSLTLAIGGVGLTNIMLASVIDRTREIGMMKALGGLRSMILKQFLLEASMVVTMGGLVGFVLAVLATTVIGSMPFLGPAFRDETRAGDIYLTIQPLSIVVSMTVLFLVGLIAGLVPAMKASRLDPIAALHYE
jgi:putative ABC transport system permease protein